MNQSRHRVQCREIRNNAGQRKVFQGSAYVVPKLVVKFRELRETLFSTLARFMNYAAEVSSLNNQPHAYSLSLFRVCLRLTVKRDLSMQQGTSASLRPWKAMGCRKFGKHCPPVAGVQALACCYRGRGRLKPVLQHIVRKPGW